jgi:GNAT superfamily N-acetyltransferase
MTVNVRMALAADKEACLALLGELSAATGSSLNPAMGDAYDGLLDGVRGQILVAEEQTRLLGLASVTYNLAMRYGGEYCQLEELVVGPQARGKRVGALLMEATLANARSRGCAEMGLYLVASTEHNRAFYEKFGFAPVGTEMRQVLG